MVGVGKNTTNIVEEFPTPSPLPGDEDSELPKTVWVANGNVQGEEASVDCYVRVSLGYSNSDIGRAVTLKQIDRTNWVEADDGFYYYKKVLREGEKYRFMRSLCRLPDLRITEVPGNFIGLKGWKNYEEKNKDSGRNSFFEHPGDIRRVWIFFGHFAGCEPYLCGGYQDQCGRI